MILAYLVQKKVLMSMESDENMIGAVPAGFVVPMPTMLEVLSGFPKFFDSSWLQQLRHR